MKVAVLGSTGYVGGRLVPELLAAGHTVRCLVRDPARLDGAAWENDVEVRTADALDVASLIAGLDGVDVTYHLVHAMGGAADFMATDREAAANVRDASAASGVARIVYLGGLGDETQSALSPHLASRHEVGRILADGPVPVTELRAAVIIGSGSASFEMLRSLVELLPIMVCPTWVTKTLCQPIAIEDVLTYLTECLAHPETAGRVLDMGGPDVVTYREMMDRYAAVAGLRKRLVIPVPVLTPSLSSHWLNLITALPIGLARPLVDSLVNDVIVRADHDIARFIDHRPIGFDAAIEAAIQRVRDLMVMTSWTDSTGGSSPAEPLPQDPGWSGGTLYQDLQEVETFASERAVFAAVRGIGGTRGWYVTPFLWQLRGVADKLVGGVGMRRGRRHPDQLRVGDAVDFFRVEVYEPNRLLRLRAEMKVPGRAWLEWSISRDDGRVRLTQLARFYPRGFLGRVYWYGLLPIHTVIFRLLAKRLVRAAEREHHPLAA